MDWQKIAIERGNRIEDLEEQIKHLRDLLAPPMEFPSEWKLAPKEELVLRAIARTGFARHSLLLDVLGEHSCENLARQYAHRLKVRLRPFGIEIKNAHGSGYYVEGESKEILQGSFRAAH